MAYLQKEGSSYRIRFFDKWSPDEEVDVINKLAFAVGKTVTNIGCYLGDTVCLHLSNGTFVVFAKAEESDYEGGCYCHLAVNPELDDNERHELGMISDEEWDALVAEDERERAERQEREATQRELKDRAEYERLKQKFEGKA